MDNIKFIAVFSLMMLLALFFAPMSVGWSIGISVYLLFSFPLFLLAFLVISYKYVQIKISSIDLIVALFMFYVFVRQLLLGINAVQADFVLALYFALVLYVVVRCFSVSFKFRQFIVIALPACIVFFGLMEASLGLFQSWQSFSSNKEISISGSFSNANLYAAFLAVTFPFIVYGFKILGTVKEKRVKKAIGILLLFSLTVVSLAIFFTNSRAAIITVLLLGLIEMFVQKNKKLWRPLFILLFTSGVLIVVYVFMQKLPSAWGRLLIWENTIAMIFHKPVFGYGIGGFEKEYMLWQANYFSTNPNSPYLYIADDVYFPFSLVLQVFVETGIVGATLLAIIVIQMARACSKTTASHLSPYLKAMAAIVVTGLFSYAAQSTPLIIIGVISFGIIASCFSRSLITTTAAPFKLVALITSIAGISYLALQIWAHKKWENGTANILINEEYALGEYQTAYPFIKHRNMFLYNYGTTLYEIGKAGKSYAILKEAETLMNDTYLNLYLGKAAERALQLEEASLYYRRAINMNPKLFYPRLYYLQLLIKQGQQEAAKEEATKIVTLFEKIPSNESKQIKEIAMQYLLEIK